MTQMTVEQFEKFRQLIHSSSGINLNHSKLAMLQAKLDKLLRQYQMDSYDDFFRLLTAQADREVWRRFIDEITVHQSGFFRENNHFEYLRNQLRVILETNKRIVRNQEIRVWSTACSTGEEPYTLGMVLMQWLPPGIIPRILATDISAGTLAQAQKGEYPTRIKKEMDPYYLATYFHWDGDLYHVKPVLKELVTFRLFNLMEPFPFRDTFDLVFCRNVLIYFGTEDQDRLVRKIQAVMTPGGLLFLGHSESLLNRQEDFKYLEPTIYQKK